MEASQRSAECQADCHRFDGGTGKMRHTVSCVVEEAYVEWFNSFLPS